MNATNEAPHADTEQWLAFHGHRVMRRNRTSFYVRSGNPKSQYPTRVITVLPLSTMLHCTCTGYQVRSMCSHTTAVECYLDWERNEREITLPFVTGDGSELFD